MIESWLFTLAVIAVLMIPGPTNALLASSAHQQGIAKTSLFIPTQLLGYLYAISLWALFIHLCSPTWPHLITILHFFSARIGPRRHWKAAQTLRSIKIMMMAMMA